jgi:polysaccharide export outer membrane protein
MKARHCLLQSSRASQPRRNSGGCCAVGTFVAALTLLAGCRSANYRAANLPAPLRAPPAARTADLDLARMAGPGFGTSQLGPGDLVELSITSGRGDDVTEPFRARVSRDGQLAVPLVGMVPVAGMEPFEAEQQIAAAAVQRNVYRQPSVTLQVTEQAVNRITVLGAVTNPGTHELPRGSSDLVGALAAAGGLTEEAGTKVDILRQGSPTFFAATENGQNNTADDGVQLASYDGANPFGSGGPPQMAMSSPLPQTMRIDLAQAEPMRSPNYGLSDRDVVMVLPDDKRLIHVTGLVQKPDQLELPRNKDVTLLDAIALAGGVKSPLADKVYVIRQLPDMPQPAVIQVSLAKAKHDGNENLRLAPGDLVSVEQTIATTVFDTATSLFRVTAGLGGSLATF